MSADPRPSLALRLERADLHLAAINAKRHRWLSDGEDGCIVGEFNAQTGEYIFRLHGKPPPDEFGILVGDFAHSLRSALDNAVWALVLHRTGSAGSSLTQFTIADTKNYWQQRYRSQLRGLRKTDRAIIREAQPYRRSDGRFELDPLSRLNWLNIRDKHHVLHASYVENAPVSMVPAPETVPFWPVPAPGHEGGTGELVNVTLNGGPFDSNDAVVAVAVLVGARSDLKMHMQGTLPVDVAFGDPPRSLRVHDLVEIRRKVETVIERLGEAWD